MTEETSPSGNRSGKAILIFVLGLCAGAVVGLSFGGTGLFSGAGSVKSKKTADTDAAVTFTGGTASGGGGGGTLDALLDPSSAMTGGNERTRQVLAYVDGLSPGELEDQLDEVFARRRGNRSYDLIANLYQKWVEQDPAAALAHAEGLEGKNRKTALNLVLSAWATKEPYEALAWMEEHGNMKELQSAASSVLRVIAMENPEKAIELASLKWMSGVSTSALYAIWAEKDPQTASARALAIPNPQERNNALQSLAREWAYQNPQAVWEWGNGLERKRDRDTVLGGVVGTVTADGDTSQAIAFLEAMGPGDSRRSALEQIVRSMLNTDPESAYEFARSQIKSGKEAQVYSSLLYQWAQTDPDRAFEVALKELDPGNARNSALQSVINEVAGRDPALAKEMLRQLDPEAMENSVYSVARALARNDVVDALAWAGDLPEGDAKRNAYSNILSEWAEEDPEKASAWGLQIEDEDVRNRSLQSVLSRWSSDDVVGAMTWAVKNLDVKEQVSLIPGSLLYNWVYQDAAEAADWVAALPEGELRNASVSGLISSWSQQDLVATGEWLNRMKPGQSRDQAARQYSYQVFESDPESALIWAESITKEEDRFSQVENLARRYLENDPARARRWIAGSSLPQERREQLLGQGR